MFSRNKFIQAKTPKFMQNPSNFDEKWPKKETQHFKHQLPSRLMFMKKTQDL